MVWVVREYMSCLNHIFQKKENAQKCLREWLTVETKIWERKGQNSTWWPNCETWDDVVDYLMSQGGDLDVAWIDTVKFED